MAKPENMLAVTGSSGAEKSFLRKGWYLVSAVEIASRDWGGGERWGEMRVGGSTRGEVEVGVREVWGDGGRGGMGQWR